MKEGMFYVLCFKEDDEKRWFLSQIQVGEMEMQEMDLKYKKSIASQGKDKGGALD